MNGIVADDAQREPWWISPGVVLILLLLLIGGKTLLDWRLHVPPHRQ